MTDALDETIFADALAGGPCPSFEAAVTMFLEYLKGYRSCAAVSIRAYRRDIEGFARFMSETVTEVPPPDQITRQHVMQFAVG